MTEVEEIKKLVEDGHKAIMELQRKNDERLKALEKKGHAPADDVENVDKLNKTISELEAQIKTKTDEINAEKKRIDQIETAMKRGTLGRTDGTEVKSWDGKRTLTAQEAKHRAATAAFLRKNIDQMSPEQAAEVKAMISGDDANGGYLVDADLSGRIITKVFETSPMRQFASVITTTKSAVQGKYDDGETSSGWVGETESRSETNTPQVGEWEIPVYEIYAKPKISQNLLDDASLDLEAWLAGKVADKFERQENDAFLNGAAGTKKPRGILTYATTEITSMAVSGSRTAGGTFGFVKTGANGDFTADFIVKLPHKLKKKYRDRGNYFFSREGIEKVRLLKDSQNRYLWNPGFGQFDNGTPAMVNGYAYGEFNDLPALATNSLSCMFGDMAETYTIIDRQGIRILRNPFTDMPYVIFYTTKRVGGGALNFESLVIGKCAA